jgi:hypothetical protein
MTDARSSTPQRTRGSNIDTLLPQVELFAHRVRVLTEVVDDADEIALVTATFRKMGWVVRSANSSEVHGYPAKSRTWLVVEVRFNGYSRTAPRVAVKRIDEITERLQLRLCVRYAESIRFAPQPEKTYYIDETPARGLTRRWLPSRTLQLAGIPRITGLIRIPADNQKVDVRGELARYDLGNPFDPSRNSVRPALPEIPEEAHRAIPSEAPSAHIRLMGVAGLVLSVLFGVTAIWVSGAWKAFPVAAGVAMTGPIARTVPCNQPLIRRLSIGFAWAATLTLCGVILESQIPDRRPLEFLYVIGATLLAFFTGHGTFLALRGSGIARHVSWLLPLTVTALIPFLLGLGGMFDTEYLTYDFGIPASSVSVPTFLRLAVAGRSILIGLAVALLLVAIIGWVRYFHGFDTLTRGPLLLMATAVGALYLLASIGSGLSSVDTAAHRAAALARAGRQPTAYFGLQPVLECLRPVSPTAPVYNGPVPVSRPVLSFGASGTQLWIWNPTSEQSISVPLQDIIAIPANGTPAHC